MGERAKTVMAERWGWTLWSDRDGIHLGNSHYQFDARSIEALNEEIRSGTRRINAIQREFEISPSTPCLYVYNGALSGHYIGIRPAELTNG